MQHFGRIEFFTARQMNGGIQGMAGFLIAIVDGISRRRIVWCDLTALIEMAFDLKSVNNSVITMIVIVFSQMLANLCSC